MFCFYPYFNLTFKKLMYSIGSLQSFSVVSALAIIIMEKSKRNRVLMLIIADFPWVTDTKKSYSESKTPNFAINKRIHKSAAQCRGIYDCCCKVWEDANYDSSFKQKFQCFFFLFFINFIFDIKCEVTSQ